MFSNVARVAILASVAQFGHVSRGLQQEAFQRLDFDVMGNGAFKNMYDLLNVMPMPVVKGKSLTDVISPAQKLGYLHELFRENMSGKILQKMMYQTLEVDRIKGLMQKLSEPEGYITAEERLERKMRLAKWVSVKGDEYKIGKRRFPFFNMLIWFWKLNLICME